MSDTKIDVEKILRKRKPTGHDAGKLYFINKIKHFHSFYTETEFKGLCATEKHENLLIKIAKQENAEHEFYTRHIYIRGVSEISRILSDCTVSHNELAFSLESMENKKYVDIDKFFDDFFLIIKSHMGKIFNTRTCAASIIFAFRLDELVEKIDDIVQSHLQSTQGLIIEFLKQKITNDENLIEFTIKKLQDICNEIQEIDESKKKRISHVQKELKKVLFTPSGTDLFIDDYYLNAYNFIRFGKSHYAL